MSFTTYLESWNQTKPIDVVNSMISAGALTSNCRLVLAFASFNFTAPDYIPGLQNMSLSDVQTLTNLVHSRGARISLSIGGATYPFANSNLYSRPGDLASNINKVLTMCGFDGVDFDIEDNYNNVPANFANQAASLINTLRSINKGLYISLTTPAQAWAPAMYQKSLLNMTIGNINAWQPMEYDLWMETNYVDQIKYDINYYVQTWSVSPNKIILGLMPGADDMGHNLSLQDALNLTNYSHSTGLQGVMIWDSNLDAAGRDGNAPFAYTMGIQSQILRLRRIPTSMHYTTVVHYL